MTTLFVDISSHGLGHLAQVAPVLNALNAQAPDVRLSIRSGLPLLTLQARIKAPFTHISGCSDVVFAMHDATRIDTARSARRFRDFHANWAARVVQEALFLRTLAPQLVLSDVAYLPLAGAAQAGIPSMAMCSLNWGDIVAHVFANEAWAEPIAAQIFAAYQYAECFFCVQPAMPMPRLENMIDMPPVALCATARRDMLCQALGIPAHKKIILAAFGGFDKALAPQNWPYVADTHWLIPTNWDVQREDMSVFTVLDWPFPDILASVDAVLTKPGYGTFVEAACSGIAVLYVPRHNWPEQDALVTWLTQHTRCQAISEHELSNATLTHKLHALWQQHPPMRPVALGNERIAHELLRRLYSASSGSVSK